MNGGLLKYETIVVARDNLSEGEMQMSGEHARKDKAIVTVSLTERLRFHAGRPAIILAAAILLFVVGGMLSSCNQSMEGPGYNHPAEGGPDDGSAPYSCYIDPEDVDESVEGKFGADDTAISPALSPDEAALVGNWAGKDSKSVSRTWLQLRADGTYEYKWWIGLGKYHDVDRVIRYSGTWHLQKKNSQLVLELPDAEFPLVFSSRFPELTSPQGTLMCPGTGIDASYKMVFDPASDKLQLHPPSQAVQDTLNATVFNGGPDYFTVVAAKANSPDFWDDITPKGFNYGHKIYKPFLQGDVDNWEYAKRRAENDPKNYIVVITDESWVKIVGARQHYARDVLDPGKLYALFGYWKAEMQLLSEVNGPAMIIIAGDAPPYWAGAIRKDFENDANKVPARVVESRFPEALELNPPDSFAGVFQVLDYIRMKYAPNVKIGYTLKTWGSEGFAFQEPSEGWDDNAGVQTMADYLNSFGVQFDILSFNFNPTTGDHTDDEYKAGAKYFAAISKKMRTRDGSLPKIWIWKVSLWSDHPSFYFRNVDFMVRQGNAIGMTLGHGNDLSGKSGFEDFTRENGEKSLIHTWMHEYFEGRRIGSGPHATPGPVYWR